MLEAYEFIVRDTLTPKRSLKVGETIKVKPLKIVQGVRDQHLDFANGFVAGMYKYCGQVGKITLVSKNSYFSGYKNNSYKIDLDDGRYWWSAHMFDWEVRGVMENE